MENIEKPPELPNSPPETPLGSRRSYHWTSVTVASESSRNFSTPEPDTLKYSQESLARGDTWRGAVPRGRTLDLVAAFDQCAYQQHRQMISGLMARRLSEPVMGIVENDKMDEMEIDGAAAADIFLEDSTFGSRGSSTESEEPITVKIRREPERAPLRQIANGDSNHVEAPTPAITPIQTNTPRRPSSGNTRKLSTLNMDKLALPEIGGNGDENKENFNFPPKIGRRGTQAIVFKSSPIQVQPMHSNAGISNVRTIAHEFEEKSRNRSLSHRINAQQEIDELRRLDESQNSKNFESYDVTDGVRKLSTSSSQRQRSGIQMGVSVAKLKLKTPENIRKAPEFKEVGVDVPMTSEASEDVLITPTRGGPSQKTYISSPKSHHHQHQHQKSVALAPPFSDIPEERTCDRIDEMFDFAQKTELENFSEEKTLDRTIFDGFTEMEDSPKPANKHLQVDPLHLFETPQFTRSSTLITPHAGLPVTEYRVSEKEGLSAQKVIVHKSPHPPSALATSTPMGTVARGAHHHFHTAQDSFVSSISNYSALDRSNDSRRLIAKLIDSIDKTRRNIQLAEMSLIDAKKARQVVQELSSQRVMLICREKLKLQLDEIRRLQALAVVRHPPPPINRHFKSTMVISNISLQLNKNFQARGSFAFIVLFKCRTEVEASGVVTLLAHYQTRVHVIQFGEHLYFSNLPVDFVIAMEVYMMRVPEYRPPEQTCAAFLAQKVRNFLIPKQGTPRRQPRPASSGSISLTAGHYNHHQNLQNPPECEFRFCGKLTLDRDSAGDRNFLLDDVTYPLEGTVRLQSACSSLPESIDVEYRGFLFLFQSENSASPVPKSATWQRYWAMLHRGVIFFWKNPIDEKNSQMPISQIDLTKCTNQSIEETRTKSAAQHEFHIELLVDQTPSLLEKRRVVLAAESSDHLVSWLNAINDTLYILRS